MAVGKLSGLCRNIILKDGDFHCLNCLLSGGTEEKPH